MSIESQTTCKYLGQSLRYLLEKANFCEKNDDCAATEEYKRCRVTDCFNIVNKKADLTEVKDIASSYDAGCNPAPCNIACVKNPAQEDITCFQNKCVETRLIPTTTSTTNPPSPCDLKGNGIRDSIKGISRCVSDSDCAVAELFGCYSIVNKNADTSAIKSDVEAYFKSCPPINYMCLKPPSNNDVKCHQSRCVDARDTLASPTTTIGTSKSMGVLRAYPCSAFEERNCGKCYCMETADGCKLLDYKDMDDLTNLVNKTVSYTSVNVPNHCTKMCPCDIRLTSIQVV
jgi:hypothetical protein